MKTLIQKLGVIALLLISASQVQAKNFCRNFDDYNELEGNDLGAIVIKQDQELNRFNRAELLTYNADMIQSEEIRFRKGGLYNISTNAGCHLAKEAEQDGVADSLPAGSVLRIKSIRIKAGRSHYVVAPTASFVPGFVYDSKQKVGYSMAHTYLVLENDYILNCAADTGGDDTRLTVDVLRQELAGYLNIDCAAKP